MLFKDDNPFVVQRDGTIIAEASHQQFPIIQPMLSQLALLEKVSLASFTYKLTAYSLWSAYCQGIQVAELLDFLNEYSKFPLAEAVIERIDEYYQRFSAISIEKEADHCILIFNEQKAKDTLLADKKIGKLVTNVNESWHFSSIHRGELKELCLAHGYFIRDQIGYDKGQSLKAQLAAELQLRGYQKEAIQQFVNAGSGIVVMPCGSGKTIVGIGTIAKAQEEVLIITPNETSMKQWQREIIEKTSLKKDQVGLYSSGSKEVKPVTIVSYQMITYRDQETKKFTHLPLFKERNWGLIIYDEVHLLPAPVFRITAELQGKKRLGLTATLVREDGKEGEVYGLIGPKQYEVSWKGLENNGWIAKASCKEIRVHLADHQLDLYVESNQQQKFKIAATNSLKIEVIKKLLEKHKNQPTLIIGQYVEQLQHVANQLRLPMITGKTTQREREKLYESFRQGDLSVLVVSKVANFAVDLPDAEVAIQISGAFGSRQEEAQRVGRVLRPKKNNQACFYSIVTRNTKEEQCSSRRQLFMLEQGYSYEVEEWKL